jgi:N-acetylneuraminate synthase
MDAEDLRAFQRRLEAVLASVGPLAVRSLPEEEPARRNARRSLVAARDIPEGSRIEPADLTWKRPAHGISPRHYDDVLGLRARHPITEDTVLSWSDLDKA